MVRVKSYPRRSLISDERQTEPYPSLSTVFLNTPFMTINAQESIDRISKLVITVLRCFLPFLGTPFGWASSAIRTGRYEKSPVILPTDSRNDH